MPTVPRVALVVMRRCRQLTATAVAIAGPAERQPTHAQDAAGVRTPADPGRRCGSPAAATAVKRSPNLLFLRARAAGGRAALPGARARARAPRRHQARQRLRQHERGGQRGHQRQRRRDEARQQEFAAAARARRVSRVAGQSNCTADILSGN